MDGVAVIKPFTRSCSAASWGHWRSLLTPTRWVELGCPTTTILNMTTTRAPLTRLWVYYLLKVSYLIKWIQVSSIMGLSLGLPNLNHIHILIAHSDWHRHYCESQAAFLHYIIDKLVSNLTNYVGQAARLSYLAELIQVESRVCRPWQWINCSCYWQYRVVAPICGLKPVRVPWAFANLRSRIGCDVCLGPLWILVALEGELFLQ